MNRSLLIVLLLFCPRMYAQTDNKLGWFQDAKLGIFIHWGIYSVNGVGESWSFHNKAIPHAEYMKQIKGFTASKYDPAAWADQFEQLMIELAKVSREVRQRS